MVTFVPGRLPPHPEATHPRLRLGPHLADVAPPAAVDWYSNVTDWPMYLNDRLGDCTEAMVGHILEGVSTCAGNPPVGISDRDVLTAYERVSGYNPADPSTDQGAVLQDVYGDWRKTGVGGHKNLAFAQVDHRNSTQIRQAVAAFGAAGLGIVVTQAMMDDFNAGLPWSRSIGAQLGGHAVPAVGYDATYVYVVTWGKVQPMRWGVVAEVCDEAWVAVLPEWLDSAGRDPAGVDLYGLGQAFHELTGDPNPFPAPSPQPTPTPPGPAPADPADEALAVSARAWLARHHVGANGALAKQLQAWLSAKSL